MGEKINNVYSDRHIHTHTHKGFGGKTRRGGCHVVGVVVGLLWRAISGSGGVAGSGGLKDLHGSASKQRRGREEERRGGQ